MVVSLKTPFGREGDKHFLWLRVCVGGCVYVCVCVYVLCFVFLSDGAGACVGGEMCGAGGWLLVGSCLVPLSCGKTPHTLFLQLLLITHRLTRRESYRKRGGREGMKREKYCISLLSLFLFFSLSLSVYFCNIYIGLFARLTLH